MDTSESLASYCLVPRIINSVLSSFSLSMLKVIHLLISLMQFSMVFRYICYLWFPNGNIASIYIEAYHWGSTVVFIPIVVIHLNLLLYIYMHIDGIESINIALYEVSPCKINGILLTKFYMHFLDLLCEFR